MKGRRKYSSKQFIEPVPSVGSDRKDRTGIGVRRDALQWTALRDEFLRRNLERVGDEPRFTLRQLAEQAGVGYTRVKRVASAQGWLDILKSLIDARDSGYERREQARQALVRDQLAMGDINGEVNVRRRSAAMARRTQARAFKRLRGVDSSELSPMDALKMLKFSVDLELRALGCRLDVPLADIVQEENDLQSRIDEAKLISIGEKILEFLQGNDDQSDGNESSTAFGAEAGSARRRLRKRTK